jgi:hypothetical protein
MTFLSKDHPEIVFLLKLLQEQHNNIDKVPPFVGWANVDYLRTELYKHGWNTKLADDQKTVILVLHEQ